MKEKLFFFFLCLCFLAPIPSYAQDSVSVRTGVREGYSRVVFQWPQKTDYTVDQSMPGKLVLSFAKAASVDQTNAKFTSLSSITGMQVVSNDPLKVSLDILKDSKVRVVAAASRVIVDIYDVEGQQKTAAATAAPKNEAVAEKPKEKKTGESKITGKEKKPGKAVSAPSTEKKTQKAMAVPPAFVLVPEVLHDPEKKEVLEGQAAKKEIAAENAEKKAPMMDQAQHVLSVSSTRALDMAVFESFGELWFVMDQEGMSLMPGISGPQSEIFTPFEHLPFEHGSIYRTTMPEGLAMKSQGGGLVWRVILAKSPVAQNPVEPVREIQDDKEGLRGGKIIWPLKDVGNIVDVNDPLTGETLKVVLVRDSNQFSGAARSFVDFDVLESPIGLAIRPKVDDLMVEHTDRGIEISRKAGLAIMADDVLDTARLGKKTPLLANPEKVGETQEPSQAAHEEDHTTDSPSTQAPAHTPPPEVKDTSSSAHGKKDSNGIFNFSDWQSGSIDVLNHNKIVMLSAMHDKEKGQRAEDLLELAKMHLAHGRGAEALGFLEFAQQEMPGLEASPEFLALRGVARAFDLKSEIALGDLQNKVLEPFDEIRMWKSFVLSDLGDWKQAAEVLPASYARLYDYPDMIANRLALVLAEVNLRDGKVSAAEEILAHTESKSSTMSAPLLAAMNYLKGEAARQKRDTETAKKLWEALSTGEDDLYRAKAGLALTRLLQEEKKINNTEAIDKLERLRYAWRGDELEAQINYWLGQSYFKNNDYIKGLNIMRDAAAISADTLLGKRITGEMVRTFQDAFLKEHLKNISPMDAITLYDQFSELTPTGVEGNKLVQRLAEHLAQGNLLGRAASLLKHQVEHRLTGEDKVRTAIRLATIYLLSQQPADALSSLKIAETGLSSIPDEEGRNMRINQISLLKARAHSLSGRGGQALQLLETLPPSKELNRLRADIAWQEGYWKEASDALNDVLIDEDIQPESTLTDSQADLIMNRAIALNLANDRIALDGMRTKFSDLMLKHKKKANQFELITRPLGKAGLADRETLMSVVSEVDLFGDFLKSYGEAAK